MTQPEAHSVAATARVDAQAAAAPAVARGFAVIRVLLGLTFLLNGLSKLFGVTRVSVARFEATLIRRDDVTGIIRRQSLGFRHGQDSALPGIQALARWLLDVAGPAAWTLAGVETIAGALLVLGLASRLGALLALLPALFVRALYFSSGSWLFEEPLIWVRLFVLTVVPSGRTWGFDRRLATQRLRRSRRVWPA